MRETISHAGLQFNSSLNGNNNYICVRTECEEIRDSTNFELYKYICIYIYIYIIFLTYIYFYSITSLYHSIVSKNLFVFSMFDCLQRQRMCCHGNSESFHKWRLRTKRTHQDSPRNRSTNSTSTDFRKFSLYFLLGICIGIAYSSLVSLATVIRVLKPEQKVKY